MSFPAMQLLFSSGNKSSGPTGYVLGGIVTENDGRRIHTFNASTSITGYGGGLTGADFFLVSGGGGGGCNHAGGGGGGAIMLGTFDIADGETLSITIGSGGNGATAASSRGANGGSSSFYGHTLPGGGGGGNRTDNSFPTQVNGADGASGGGGGGESTGTSLGGTASDGNNGGNGYIGGAEASGGGGGGFNGAGENATANTGGDGGVGWVTDISGTSLWYAAGGGGGTNGGSGTYQGGIGGSGVGGNGRGWDSGDGVATSAVANTGSGGGGGGGGGSAGGNGSAGVLIISYPIPTGEIPGPELPFELTDDADLFAWYDFADLSSSGDVTSVADKSTNDFTLTSILGTHPTSDVGPNDLSIIKMNTGGTASALQAATASDWIPLSDGTTVLISFFVRIPNANPDAIMTLFTTNDELTTTKTGTTFFFEDRSSQGRNNTTLLYVTGNNGASINGVLATNGSMTTIDWHIVSVLYDPNASPSSNRAFVYIDGDLVSPSEGSSDSPPNDAPRRALRFGGADILSGGVGAMEFGEFIVVTGTSATETARANIESYLTDKWVTPPFTAPDDISGLVGWWDATDAATFTYAGTFGDSVQTWADKSSIGNNLTQATSSWRPRRNATINGLNAVKFYPADSHFLTVANLENTVGGQVVNTSTFVVAQRVVETGGGNIRALIHLGVPSTYINVSNNNIQSWTGSSDVSWGGITNADCQNPHLYVETRESGLLYHFFDGVTKDQGTAYNSTAIDDFSIGGQYDLSQFSDWVIGEVVVYDRRLSDGERQQVEGYLMDKWGL